MKLGQKTSPVELGEVESSPQSFQIVASKEAFAILSSGLYNDKILAIIRELSCNAYDSHVAAGKKDIPFTLHLPTTFEPYFSVKDEGVGLSHEHVMKLYCTYFGSSKSDSNDFVGALGLGSKSPFCYTEGFTITSKHNGKCRIYAAYISETGTPTVVLQEESETEEGNGVEVQFPVNQNDCWEFENKASSALEFFNPAPKVNIKLNISKAEYSLKSESWGMRTSAYYHVDGVRAIQGMVPYSVGSIDNSRMTESQRKLNSLPLDIFFPIGELSVAVSRETLSNDDRTIKNILTMYDKVIEEFVEEFKKKIEACSTQWEARIQIYSMINQPGIGGLINKAYNEGKFLGVYKNFTLTKEAFVVNPFDYKSIVLYSFTSSWRETSQKKRVFTALSEVERLSALVNRDHYNFTLDSSAEAMFIIGDTTITGDQYIKHHLKSGKNKIRTAFLITKANKDVSNVQLFSEAERMLSSIGNPPKTLLSELKTQYASDFESTKVDKKPVEKRDVLYFNQEANVNRQREGYEVAGWRDGWASYTEPINRVRNYYYVLLNNLVPVDATSKDGNDLYQFAESFKKFIEAVKNSQVFGIAASEKILGLKKDSPLVKQGNMIEFSSYVYSTLKQHMTPAKEVELTLPLNEFKIERNFDKIIRIIRKGGILDKNSGFQEFITLYDQAKKFDTASSKALVEVIRSAEQKKLYQVKNKTNFEGMWKDMMKGYPMLNLVNCYYHDDSDKLLIDYIKLIDKVEAEKEKEEVNNVN